MKVNMTRSVSWFYIIAGLILVGCSSGLSCGQTAPSSFEGRTSDKDTSLQTGIPCDPPCWYGISPGVSRQDDALDILKASPFVLKTHVTNSSVDSETYIYWTSPSSGPENWAGEILINQEGVVSYIYVEQLNYALPVSDLLRRLGEPDWVYIGRTDMAEGFSVNTQACYAIELIWLEKGLRIMLPSVAENQFRESGYMVNDNSQVMSAFYFNPVGNLQEYLNNLGTSEETANYYHKWNGLDKITP
jgi:hypothetical protein